MKLRSFAFLILTAMILDSNAVRGQEPLARPDGEDIVKTDPVAASKLESRLVGPAFQVTLGGLRAGEGYLSRDGRWMVFQSERRPDNPFFQIYLMDLQTGNVESISPGHGKTTCAWVHPDLNRVLFASTHDDPAARTKQLDLLELRAAGNEPRYAWDYDEHYEIYVYDRAKKSYANLTSTPGYDAEGSYSPDGEWIAFSSNRRAYTEKMTPEEAEQFKLDKSTMADLYLMKADGTEVKRLTDAPGYDGGPFFSPDGKQICWRHFPTLESAEIWTMNVDGTDKRQLTRWGALSWAPFYHPSGKYLIFGTNRHGFDNFELYLVSTDGGDPVRVTYAAGFDSLPTFTPSGDRLYWTSTRAGKNGQIFSATWNHQAALRALSLDDATDIARHVAYLCRPELEGRLTGTEGEKKATEYVAAFMDQLGLKPAAPDGSWFHEFEFLAGAKLGGKNELATNLPNAKALKVDEDWRPLSFSKSGKIEPGPIVFAGYGISVPRSEQFAAYDSFVHLDVKDKWVMVFRFMPESISPEQRQQLAPGASLRDKARTARDLGAKGLIVVSGPTSRVREQLVPLQRDSALSGTSIPVISISDEVARSWLKANDKDLNELQTQLDSGELTSGFELAELKLGGEIDVEQVTEKGRNVLGRLQVGTSPSEQVVVVGAHIDHLGRGTSNSLAREEEKGEIHFGADDNASGVAAMLEAAEQMAEEIRQNPGALRRDIVFAAWSGEELGLHGSRALVADVQRMMAGHGAAAADPHATNQPSIYPHVAAYLNMDMVGRFNESVLLQGIGSSNDWLTDIERIHVATQLPVRVQPDTNLPTDATSFFQAGVPIVSAFTGSHEDYHSPRDTPDKLDYERTAQIADFMEQLARSVSARENPPQFIEPRVETPAVASRGSRVYLGTIPDYAASVSGMQISGVTKGAPAEQAGLQSKDVIVELAGKKIENIHDYMAAMDALKIGEKVTIVVIRNNERVSLEIIPGSRQ